MVVRINRVTPDLVSSVRDMALAINMYIANKLLWYKRNKDVFVCVHSCG